LEKMGTVVKTYDNKATVLIVRATACGENCGSCGGCKQTRQTVIANNEIGAKTGDRVKLEHSDKNVLLAAFFVYIVPIFLFIAGLAAFNIYVGAAAFAAVFAVLRLLDKRLALRYTANITKAWRNGS